MNPIDPPSPSENPGYVLGGPSERARRRLQFDAWYDTFVRNIERSVALLEPMGGSAAPPLRILDAACGEGLHSADLAARYPSAQVTGFDVNAAAIERAADLCRSLHNARFFVHDANEPFPAALRGPFDLLHVRLLLGHMRDPARVLRNLREVMRPGAVLCVVDTPEISIRLEHPSIRTLTDCMNRVQEVFGTRTVGSRHVELLEGCGFTVVQSDDEVYPMTGLGGEHEIMLKVILDIWQVLGSAFVNVLHAMTAEEHEEHMRRIREEIRPSDRGTVHLQVTYAGR